MQLVVWMVPPSRYSLHACMVLCIGCTYFDVLPDSHLSECRVGPCGQRGCTLCHMLGCAAGGWMRSARWQCLPRPTTRAWRWSVRSPAAFAGALLLRLDPFFADVQVLRMPLCMKGIVLPLNQPSPLTLSTGRRGKTASHCVFPTEEKYIY